MQSFKEFFTESESQKNTTFNKLPKALKDFNVYARYANNLALNPSDETQYGYIIQLESGNWTGVLIKRSIRPKNEPIMFKKVEYPLYELDSLFENRVYTTPQGALRFATKYMVEPVIDYYVKIEEQ